ncbi:MAG: tRNA (N(6)-L-threonylcarbamoyladenosine(37)-C(2))-methylthiotransferase MtaB [Parachlamydiales bacterium]|nr:tRNA (N(6)-L-threonylcarbamoyladenosine(37)-C(2))-methylthiotransferase MtaB [Parachlamydiales bacterium]
MKKKFKVITLGCRTNQYESQAISDQLKGLGLIHEDENFDYCIINSCSVTGEAEKTSLKQIPALMSKNPSAKFYFTGCITKEALKTLDENIFVIPNHEKHLLVEKMFPERVVPSFNIKTFENHTRAFLKIQDGCDNFCTYCVIPYTRGRSRSRNSLEIINEVNILIDNGYKEIILTGINLGEYNSDIKFSELLKKLNDIKNLERIRLSSIDPDHISLEVVEALTSLDKIMPSLHLVLQSGSDRILKKMNRKYDTKLYLDRVKTLLDKNKNFTFSTDVIVGFPSETEKDFQNSIDILNEVKFLKVHVFPYSKRPQTAAAKFLDHLSDEIISERKTIISQIAEQNAFDLRNRFLNTKKKVLLENEKNGYFLGHTDNNLLVAVPKDEVCLNNEILDVEILQNLEDKLLGKLCR